MSHHLRFVGHRPQRAALVVFGVLALAACGSSGKPSGAGKRTSSAATPGLAFSKCMRSHGVPNFPDPNTPGGGFQVRITSTQRMVDIGAVPGVDVRSPAFLAAYAGCRKLLPRVGPRYGPQHTSAAALAQARTRSRCMRAHGVANWPDPGTYLPDIPNPAAVGLSAVITIDGAVFLIPASINSDAPAFVKAAANCGLPYGGANRP
jgi:hypothetical protein